MKRNIDQIIDARAGAEHRRDPCRHGSAAELWSGIRRGVPPGVPGPRARAPRASSSRSCWLASPGHPNLNLQDGIHPNPRGRCGRLRNRVEGAAARARPDVRHSMIELRGVTKSVPSGTGTLTILHPLDLMIPHGTVAAITGPSGSGKSTLLGLVAGLDAPTAGSIYIDGVDITALDEDGLARLRGTRIGFVFQFFHLLPSLTAYENVLVPMEIAGARDAAAARDCASRRGRAGRPLASLSVAALRRRAAARRDCARAGQRSAAAARRRTDWQPRHGDRPHDHRAAAQHQSLPQDDAGARDARPGTGGARRHEHRAARWARR